MYHSLTTAVLAACGVICKSDHPPTPPPGGSRRTLPTVGAKVHKI